jgi:hypothetical protein
MEAKANIPGVINRRYLDNPLILPKQWKKEYPGASNSERINRAKTFLVDNAYNTDLLFLEVMFLDFDKDEDYKKYVKTFLRNKKQKARSTSKGEVKEDAGSKVAIDTVD